MITQHNIYIFIYETRLISKLKIHYLQTHMYTFVVLIFKEKSIIIA